MDDVLQWAIPTQVENPQVQDDNQHVDDHPEEDHDPTSDAREASPDQPEDDGPWTEVPLPRRSSSRNKGKPTKYQDFVSEEELAQHLQRN